MKYVFSSALILSSVVLMGCADGMARIHAAGSPVVRAASNENGAFGKDVRRVESPRKITRGSDGECWDYIVSANGSTLPYYVVVGSNDRVGRHAFATCAAARQAGNFK
ncbi:hypothetical protein [Burkholderia lata]|uniref:hypothetical protein n=1 Tax=Burkholderia lata (strain ATCC 17760 / DSM 23089 / LMG 22485 / NCIMB 9086 / R18194 / 383) TaxID=482957 RepID=UPI0015843719|nr:hypothetical protein [Burkholderia lata]